MPDNEDKPLKHYKVKTPEEKIAANIEKLNAEIRENFELITKEHDPIIVKQNIGFKGAMTPQSAEEFNRDFENFLEYVNPEKSKKIIGTTTNDLAILKMETLRFPDGTTASIGPADIEVSLHSGENRYIEETGRASSNVTVSMNAGGATGEFLFTKKELGMDNTYIAGPGTDDKAYFQGKRSDYEITEDKKTGKIHVESKTGGQIDLVGIEKLNFIEDMAAIGSSLKEVGIKMKELSKEEALSTDKSATAIISAEVAKSKADLPYKF